MVTKSPGCSASLQRSLSITDRQKTKSMQLKHTLAALASLAAACALTIQPASAGDHKLQRSVTVQASASVNAAPDMARIRGGVHTKAETAAEALKANTQKMANVVDGLKALGIEARDIQTSNFNVNPQYTHSRDGRPPQITGYQVTNEVAILMRDLKSLGSVLDKVISLGANQINGLSFEVSNAEELADTARREAIANARRRAQLFATAADAEVGEVLEIREGGSPSVGRAPIMEASAARMAAPIEPGEQTLTTSVTVTWALK